MSGRTARIDVRGHHGVIEVDGVDVADAVVGFRLVGQVNHVPRLELDLRIMDRGEAYVTGVRYVVPPATCDLLCQLGWTPPAENGATP